MNVLVIKTMFERAQDQLIEGLRRSVDVDLPQGPYRDFCISSLSPENPDRSAWLQMLGVPQLVRLTLAMFDGILREHEIERILEHSVPMNVYQVWEVVSDNLCIGLGSKVAGDDTREARRAVLDAFNSAVIDRLKGGHIPARSSLLPIQADAAQICVSTQSLSPGKLQALTRAYVERHLGVSSDEIERSAWPQLVANVETCARVADHAAGLAVGPMVRWGLIHRYRAVSTLLEEPDMILSRRVPFSADAILVVPTLAYYVGFLMDISCSADDAVAVVEDGTLGEVLFSAAFLVRLLNDLGTTLLTSADDRRALMAATRERCAREDGADRPFAPLLLEGLARFGPLLGRLSKDIVHGEINIALSGLDRWPARRAVSYFERRLERLAQQYAEVRRYFIDLSADVAARLGDGRAIELVGRFVQFHEKLYARSYATADGEYAI
ncbi:MAG TPA: hypothetical protein VE093_06630 [Polyangiaceae bacterium]|nr:hypothetical protein [Polyangiaceae bacterium]